jgi:NAD+ synthase (glutamine-hydrolysing)
MSRREQHDSSRWSFTDEDSVVATVDLEDVRAYRTSKSRALQATKQPAYERGMLHHRLPSIHPGGIGIVLISFAVEVGMSLSNDSHGDDPFLQPSDEIELHFNQPEEEIAYGPA